MDLITIQILTTIHINKEICQAMDASTINQWQSLCILSVF